MLIRLMAGSEEPVYVQIAASIAAQIEDGVVGAGDRLPTARVVAESLGVNMHTVLKAYRELEIQGLVEMRRGRGGVRVREPGIQGQVEDLVAAAKERNVSRSELIRLVEEKW